MPDKLTETTVQDGRMLQSITLLTFVLMTTESLEGQLLASYR